MGTVLEAYFARDTKSHYCRLYRENAPDGRYTSACVLSCGKLWSLARVYEPKGSFDGYRLLRTDSIWMVEEIDESTFDEPYESAIRESELVKALDGKNTIRHFIDELIRLRLPVEFFLHREEAIIGTQVTMADSILCFLSWDPVRMQSVGYSFLAIDEVVYFWFGRSDLAIIADLAAS